MTSELALGPRESEVCMGHFFMLCLSMCVKDASILLLTHMQIYIHVKGQRDSCTQRTSFIFFSPVYSPVFTLVFSPVFPMYSLRLCLLLR